MLLFFLSITAGVTIFVSGVVFLVEGICGPIEINSSFLRLFAKIRELVASLFSLAIDLIGPIRAGNQCQDRKMVGAK